MTIDEHLEELEAHGALLAVHIHLIPTGDEAPTLQDCAVALAKKLLQVGLCQPKFGKDENGIENYCFELAITQIPESRAGVPDVMVVGYVQ